MSRDDLPSYEKLFGSLDYSSADEYRSVLSPAAYLVDIMNLKNWNYDEGGADAIDAIDDRRDDISEIPLNAENTITEIPHLDVVNRIMEDRISKSSAGADPYVTLAAATFPLNLPFSRYQTEIRTLLEYFKTDPLGFYKAFTASPITSIAALEYLGLSVQEQEVITTSATDGTLKSHYGLKDDETICDLSRVSRFRKATGLSALQVTELLFQNLGDDERRDGIASNFFINRSATDKAHLVIRKGEENDVCVQECIDKCAARAQECTEQCKNDEYLFIGRISADGAVSDGAAPTSEHFDRIHRFIRLARKTGLSFADLDLVLTAACGGVLDGNAIPVVAVVKWLQNTFELPVDEICALFSAFKDYGKGNSAVSESLFDRTFNNGYDVDIDDPRFDRTKLKNRVQAALGCSESEYNAIQKYLEGAEKTIEPGPSRLALPYRIKKLSTLFDIPVESLFTLFRLIDRNHQHIDRAKFPLPIGLEQTIPDCISIITSEASTPVAIANILWLVQVTSVIMRWLNDSELTVEQLEFICSERSSSAVEGVLTSEEAAGLFRDLHDQFSAVLFKGESLLSGVTDNLTAAGLYKWLSDPETGVCTFHGIVGGVTTDEELLPVYRQVIRERLLVEPADFAKTGLPDADLDVLVRTIQREKYVDLDGYIDVIGHKDFFSDPANAASFLGGTEFSGYSAIVFSELAERVKSNSRADDAAPSECAAIAEKISVQAARQQSVLFGAVGAGLNIAPDIAKILSTTVFRTSGEAGDMATVRFMTPVIEAVEREKTTGKLILDPSLVSSFRRLQQFGLLASKSELSAREIETLFLVKDLQNALPEKLKLPADFVEGMDAVYSDADNNVYVFNGDRYARFSGTDYAFEATGPISELAGVVPDDFHAGIDAAIRDWAPVDGERRTYFFSGANFSNAAAPDKVEPTANYWGKVHNHIAETGRVDAAYRSPDGKLYLFSDDQYVRYSGLSREYVDQGYPKNTLRNWNQEHQIQLPAEIRRKVDSIFVDVDGKTYLFSDDKFVDSSDPLNVQKTNEHWAKVVNNIVDRNEIDAVLVRNGKTYLFSGNQYTRYSEANSAYTDESYPREMASSWNNEEVIALSGEYLERIDAGFIGVDDQVYLFNGNTFISTASDGGPSRVDSKWGRVRNNIASTNRVDAALVSNSRVYLFSGDQYYRHSGPDYTVLEEGYPKRIANWSAVEGIGTLPEEFSAGISAALTSHDNTAYFFSGSRYVSSRVGAQPGQITDNWARVRNNIQSSNRINAVFVAPDGKTYVFSGDQFFRYSGANYAVVDEKYPKRIADHWGDLPDAFRSKIDAAFRFDADGTDRLYLFSGGYYVRYSTGDYSRIDAGYPKELDILPNAEGPWFEPIFKANPGHQYNDRIIATIFTDQFNGKPRINYFFYDKDGVHKLIKYEYRNNNYHWSNAVPVSSLNIAPFATVDAGFSGADGKVYLFSGDDFATMKGDYNGITTPASINGTWGRVLNRFHDLGRVDAAFTAANGHIYLFCDTQYVRYSGDIAPESDSFVVEEGYPRTIAGNWSDESAGIGVPAIFKPEGSALLAVPGGTTYCFNEDTFTTSTGQDPLRVDEVWGKVVNNFMELNRVDAAFVHDNKTYLFSGNQYTRYSADYSGYGDEGYPRPIARIATVDGIEAVAQFPDGIDAVLDWGVDSFYVFAGGKYVSSGEPFIRNDINSRFGIVRNNIAATGIIDAVDISPDGVLYLFSGDQYTRYSGGRRDFADQGYPKVISHWQDFEGYPLPPAVSTGITASFTDADGEQYFFTDAGFFTRSNPEPVIPTTSTWGKLRNNIQDTGTVDAAFIAPNGKTYLFSGDQYVRYSHDPATHVKEGYPNADGKANYVDEGFPQSIDDNWGNLPDVYRDGIDAGFAFDGRIYLVNGDAYVRYSDPACRQVDPDFPRKIASTMGDLPELRPNDVKSFQQLKALSRDFDAPDKSILQYLKDSKNEQPPGAQPRQLSSVTDWPEQEIDLLTTSGALSGADIGDIQVLTEMSSLFGLSERMGSLPLTLKTEAWDKIHGGAIDLLAAATALAGQLKTVTGAAAWKGLAAELRNKMNLARRDALLGYLIYRMEQETETGWIRNPRDLYEYLLIDVEMGEEATTSRIQEAIMCMQLFYHRMLMNLEDESPDTMTEEVRANLKSWWKWMKNYRVWEANRKVFLYPENYIRPELRLDKSPEFKELEEALLQGDITDDVVESAYKTYLDRYGEVSRLKIAGGYVYNRDDDTSGDNTIRHPAEKKIVMFGYSSTEPKKYYYMTGEILGSEGAQSAQTIDWAPWKEIGITIDAERVYPVYSFNRLFVFWVEVRERDQSKYEDSVGPDNKKIQYDPVIYYSFFNLKGEWVSPQKMFDVGKLVDKLGANHSSRQIFIDDADNKKNKPAEYVPAREILTGDCLYVTNPITSWQYSSDEYIYISFEARHSFRKPDNSIDRTIEFTFRGKLKSNLEFDDKDVDQSVMDRLDRNVQLPFEKFGIDNTVSFSRWKGFFNDALSAPWFSFNAEGGSFLLKPAVVPDPPEVKDDMQLLDLKQGTPPATYTWKNLPDAGFTDDTGTKHLFYRDSQDQDAAQYYSSVTDGILSAPVPVADRWGVWNVFVRHPSGIESVAVNNGKTFIATDGNRYMSYTGPALKFIDQESDAATLKPFSLSEILPSGATSESWQRIREALEDFVDTLDNAFVFSGDDRLYLVARPANDGGGTAREYTMPDFPGFWTELAVLVPEAEVADALRGWTTVRSATLYAGPGDKRLYITSGEKVFVRNYSAKTNSIHSLAELTHPDLMNPVYDPTPPGAVATDWADVAPNLMDFIARLAGVGSEGGRIRFIAGKADSTFEFSEPAGEELFAVLSTIIDDPVISAAVASWTEFSAADLYASGGIKRLYVRSRGAVVIFDYTAAAWSLRQVSELIDVTAKVPSLDGLLPAGSAVPWSDVAEDFDEYMATVQGGLVWKGKFYLYAPKAGGGLEYTEPSASEFWGAVARSFAPVSGFTAVDAAGITTENGTRRLYATFGEKVVSYDFGSSKPWSLLTIHARWGIGFGNINGLIQAPDGKVYIFSGNSYAEAGSVEKFLTDKWGSINALKANPVKMIDSAFTAGGKIYLFSGADIYCYSSAASPFMEAGYPRKLHFVERPTDPGTYDSRDFVVYKDDVKELFAADASSTDEGTVVEIADTQVRTNTAFVQTIPSGEEKLYLLLDISARIKRPIWRWRWRWAGGWRMHDFWSKRHRVWWGRWQREPYRVTVEHDERKSVYLRFSQQATDGVVRFVIDEDYPRLITGNWSNLPGDFNRMVTATFEDEVNGERIFYAVRSLREKIDGQDKDWNLYVKYTGEDSFPREIAEEQYEIIRLTSNTSEALKQRIFIDGIDGLLSPETQELDELPRFQSGVGTNIVFDGKEKDYVIVNDNEGKDVISYKSEYLGDRVPAGDTLDFKGINGQYYWELFFHAPFLIAQAFNNAQKFEEGNRWYEYIFDPTEGVGNPATRYWKFLPFREDIESGSQREDVNDEAQYSRYLNHPFDAHAIAGLRQIAYRKTIVMAYIDNLIDWGDMRFRQYTRETINEARMYYVLAYDILGKKPELVGTKSVSDAKTYKELQELRQGPTGLNMALIEMENLPGNAVIPFQGSTISPTGSLLDPYGYFHIPENREFADYWNRVEDRLYKIRYGLNIEGVKQRLALFEPPIDVMALVRAVGSGMGLAQALADFNVAVPHYRFSFILGKARELNSRLTQFGQSLLSALEKKDAEELALLRNTHEKAIMKLTLDIKNAQLQDSEETLKSLRANLKGAKLREAHYGALIASGLSPFEQAQLGLLASAQIFTGMSQQFSVMSSVSGIAPEAGAFAFHWGGHNLAALFSGLSQSFSAISSDLSFGANLSSILGGYHRRGQDWGLQQRLAQCDVENIERQIAGAEIKVKIARLDIESAKTNIKNLESVDTFMKGKFSNLQLYRWMTGKLSALYFQTYQMALDMAKWAEKSFQFELGYKEGEMRFISPLYWDSLKKGLLAGETLQVDLDRMEKAYLEKNRRRFEISKTVSLLALDPLALLNLREKRVCEFSLGEELFDYDFPGHYCRQIKTVSLTFPAVAGPYENVNATLTQLSHRTLLDPDKAGVEYLLGAGNGVDQPLSIRADWRTNQQVALSRGVNDTGLFQLNFQDERYLPFEGTGAVSTWRLELNGQQNAFDVSTLSDVVVKIEYSALQGGEVFAAAVKKLLKPSPAAKIFNLSQDFSAEWNSFMENPSAGLKIRVTRAMFPNMGQKNKVVGLYMLFALSREGADVIGDTSMELNTKPVKPATPTDMGEALSIGPNGSNWTLKPASSAEEFKPENISNIALVCMYEKKPEF